MPKQSPYDEDYDSDEYDEKRNEPRRFKKEKPQPTEKRKQWDKENHYSRHDDYED